MSSACHYMSEYILIVMISSLCLDTLGLWLHRPRVEAYDGPDTEDRCNREPAFSNESYKTPGDQGFRIRIVGHDDRYTPQHVYTGGIACRYNEIVEYSPGLSRPILKNLGFFRFF